MDFPQTRMLFRQFEDVDGARDIIGATMKAIADDLSRSAMDDGNRPLVRRTVLATVAHELRLCSGD